MWGWGVGGSDGGGANLITNERSACCRDPYNPKLLVSATLYFTEMIFFLQSLTLLGLGALILTIDQAPTFSDPTSPKEQQPAQSFPATVARSFTYHLFSIQIKIRSPFQLLPPPPINIHNLILGIQQAGNIIGANNSLTARTVSALI